jgi:dihydropteroate synthase
MSVFLRCASQQLDLSTPAVMGVLNLTPDSFSEGGRCFTHTAAVEYALAMVAAGARIIDIGGESTRPGAEPVSAAEQLRRVLPVIATLSQRAELRDVVLSIDTSHATVMREAIAAGASLVNDVRALREPDALQAVAQSTAGVCLMHMRGAPSTMQEQPHYDDVVSEVCDFLQARLMQCVSQGIARERLCIDPGIGFGKTLQHNLALLGALPSVCALGVPVLLGVSRKSLFKALLDRPLAERLPGALAVTSAAILAGVSIVRTHDVAATADAVKAANALRTAGYRCAECAPRASQVSKHATRVSK